MQNLNFFPSKKGVLLNAINSSDFQCYETKLIKSHYSSVTTVLDLVSLELKAKLAVLSKISFFLCMLKLLFSCLKFLCGWM